MSARSLMIQRTISDAGNSTLVTALCFWPFKSYQINTGVMYGPALRKIRQVPL